MKKLESTLTDPAARASSDDWKKAIKGLDAIDPGVVHHRVVERLASGDWAGSRVKIAVVHHPISPVITDHSVTPYNGLINAAAVKNALLRSKVSLVLHGHLHTGWFGSESWPDQHGNRRRLNIASWPSLGSSYNPGGNGFQSIELLQEGDRSKFRVQRYINSGEDWQPSGTALCFDASDGC